MLNQERYKTPEERAEAFRKFCTPKKCAECECTKQRKMGLSLCEYVWLTLEAEEEKPLPCPFCDYPSPYLHNDGERWLVDCGACGAQIFRATRESAIAAWNRRAK